jgi:hypothetical protein
VRVAAFGLRDAAHLITASDDGTVRLWNSATGMESHVLRGMWERSTPKSRMSDAIPGLATSSQATGVAVRVQERVEQPLAYVHLAARELSHGLHKLVAVHLPLLQAAKDEHLQKA